MRVIEIQNGLGSGGEDWSLSTTPGLGKLELNNRPASSIVTVDQGRGFAKFISVAGPPNVIHFNAI